MSETIYCGSGTEKKFDQGGSIINVHLKLDGMKDLFDRFGYTNKKGEKIIKLNISERRQVGQYGETHSVSIDTWKPSEHR